MFKEPVINNSVYLQIASKQYFPRYGMHTYIKYAKEFEAGHVCDTLTVLTACLWASLFLGSCLKKKTCEVYCEEDTYSITSMIYPLANGSPSLPCGSVTMATPIPQVLLNILHPTPYTVSLFSSASLPLTFSTLLCS